MTDIDAAATTPEPVTAVSMVPGRHVHAWTVCPCGAQRDLEAPRRGRSARRFGIEQERRIERVYGPRKVGEHGDAIDLIGRDLAWQSKATHDAPPDWMAAVTTPVLRRPTALVWSCATAMEPILAGRAPAVIQTFVRRDGPKDQRTRDWVWVPAEWWGAWHGTPAPFLLGDWVVMSGQAFLVIHGRDEEAA